MAMTTIKDVTVQKFSGEQPDEETLENIIENRQEEGLELHETKVNSVYMSQSGLEVYTVTMLFKEREDTGLFNEDGKITEELEGL